MEDLPTEVESLEEEDLVYLDYYLDGNYSDSPSFKDFPSTWSPLSETIGGYSSDDEPSAVDKTISISSLSKYVDVSPPRQHLQSCLVDTLSPDSVEDFPQDERPARKTKGIPKERFVSYEAFPSVRGKPFPCELCGLKLATKESKKRHIVSQHVKERRHACDVCHKTFIFKFALKAHSAIHLVIPKFVCVCGMSFKLRTSYMNHIRRIHRAASDMKHSCELCFKSFGDRHTLRLHMISVHKPKTIPCIQKGCSKVFSSISLMRCHYRYHLKQKFTCDECGQSFSTESYMKKHVLTHSGVRPYACLDCGKTYLSASHRNQHRRICHSSARMHQCSFCGKCFKTKDLMNYHESNHRGEKPFKCEVCGYATAYKNSYYAHRKKKLNNKCSPDTGQKELLMNNSSCSRGLKGSNPVETKNKPRKLHPLKKSKLNVGTDNQISSIARRQPQLSSACSSSDNVMSSSSCSPTSLSFSSNSPSSCSPKQANVDFIIFPPNVINCNEQQVNESSLDSNVHLSVKCVESNVDLLTSYNKEDFHSDEQCIKDNIDLVSKEYISRQASSETEKTDCSVMLSNDGGCSNSDCLLLLVKTGENSFAGVCAYHTVSDEAEMPEVSLNSVEHLTLATVDSKYLGTDLVQKQETIPNDQKVLMVSPLKSNESLLDLDSIGQSTPLLVECDQNPIEEAISLPLPQLEGLKPSSSCHMYHSENMTPVADIDSGIPSLSGQIVDDSFHLAQLEVVCPLCDEQFFCMDTYITHLECIHN